MSFPHFRRRVSRRLILALTYGVLSQPAAAAEAIHVYGPGGPAPAMREAAAAFQAKTGVSVVVTAGPTPQWAPRVATDADVIFSGSEAMMSDFATQFAAALDARTIAPLFVRPVAVLVPPRQPGADHRREGSAQAPATASWW